MFHKHSFRNVCITVCEFLVVLYVIATFAGGIVYEVDFVLKLAYK